MSLVVSQGIAQYGSLILDRTVLGLFTDWDGFLHSEGDGLMKGFQQASGRAAFPGDARFFERVGNLNGRDLCKARPGRARKRPFPKDGIMPPEVQLWERLNSRTLAGPAGG